MNEENLLESQLGIPPASPTTKILIIYDDQHPGSLIRTKYDDLEVTRISLRAFEKYPVRFRGKGFNIVLLVDGITRDDIMACHQSYLILENCCVTHNAPIITLSSGSVFHPAEKLPKP